jgi:hypothetical protein
MKKLIIDGKLIKSITKTHLNTFEENKEAFVSTYYTIKGLGFILSTVTEKKVPNWIIELMSRKELKDRRFDNIITVDEITKVSAPTSELLIFTAIKDGDEITLWVDESL